MKTNRQKLPADFKIIMNKLKRSTFECWSIGILIFSIMLLPLTFSSCHENPDEPVPPVVKKLDGSVYLQNKNELVYKATLSNVNSAKLVVNKDGALVFSEDISDVAASGTDYQMTFKYVKDDPTLKNFTKGKYEFVLTSDDFASDKLVNKSTTEIINYLPTANTSTLDQNKLNFNEPFETTLSIPKTIFSDDNPEDNPVSVTGVKSIDGKTTPTITTTSTGYDLNVKAVTGNTGAYQLELDFGSTTGGLEKTILSGTIGKDTRIVINPLVYTDDLGAPYNSTTTTEGRVAIILEALLQDPGNKVPYSDAYYSCNNYEYQLFMNSKKTKDKIIAPPGFGNPWLYNNSTATDIPTIYANGGTWAYVGTVEVPILMVTLHDKTHSPPDKPYGHGINAVLTGRDKSTGSILTLFTNYTFIEPQTDEINMPFGSVDMPKDCDEVTVVYTRIVEEPINGNYFDYVTLAKFTISNGVATCTYENTDPKYNIIKQ
jgi:hypothetical protein